MQKVWEVLQERAMNAMWFFLSRKATDHSHSFASNSCIVIVPHPDDEVLGCGGLIMRKRAAGCRVDVIMASDGAATVACRSMPSKTRHDIMALREEETLAACAKLGVESERVHFLRFPDGALSDHEAALKERIAELATELSPREIFVCALADGHRDHVALARATRAMFEARSFESVDLWEYPVWYWNFRSWKPEGTSNKRGFVLGVKRMFAAARRARPYGIALDGLRTKKREALECHRSQLGLLDDAPNSEGLPESFLSFFFRKHELFFPVKVGGL